MVTLFGLMVDVVVAVAVLVAVELAAGSRQWVPFASRALALAGVYLALVVVLLPFNSSIVLTVVEPVEGMPAAAAGIEKGDRVRAVNGVTVETFGEVAAQIAAGGSEVSLTIEHAGSQREVAVRRTAEGAVGIKSTGETRAQTPGEIFGKPVAAFTAGLRALEDQMNPRATAIGGRVVLYEGAKRSSLIASLGMALGIGGAFTFPLVAAALLASLWFRPRLLARKAR